MEQIRCRFFRSAIAWLEVVVLFEAIMVRSAPLKTLTPSGTALLVINGVFAVNQTAFETPPEVEFLM
jgi:hypothetical protein